MTSSPEIESVDRLIDSCYAELKQAVEQGKLRDPLIAPAHEAGRAVG